MKKRSILYWSGGVVLLLIILIAIGKCNGGEGVNVSVEKVTAHTIIETVSASGKIYPETEVKISPEVSGEIIALEVAEGDSVQRGQMLVKINPAMYSSAVNQASASVSQSRYSAQNAKEMMAQAKSQYELSLAAYNRNKKLFREKVISQLEFEQAEANYKGAQASYEAAKASTSGGGFGVEAAQASLSQAQANLNKTTILAPTSGIISQLNVKKGERVVGTAQMAGTEVLTIADMSRIEVRVNVSETDIAKVKLNDTCIIDADAYRTRKFKGIVSKIAVSSGSSSALSQAVNTDQVTNYTVHILILPETYKDLTEKLPKGAFVFKPGMSASVTIQTRKERNVLSVPVSAVQTREWSDSMKNVMKTNGGLENNDVRKVVFIYDKTTQKVKLHDVKTGLQDNEYIQILDNTLKQDEEVVTGPYGAVARILKEGDKVKVVKKEALYETKNEK